MFALRDARWLLHEFDRTQAFQEARARLQSSAQSTHAGVLLLRLEEARSQQKVSLVKKIFTQHAEQLPGCFAVYQGGRLRIRS